MIDYKQLFIRLVKEDSGQDLIEYALVAALVALGATAGLKPLASAINSAFTNVTSTLNSAVA